MLLGLRSQQKPARQLTLMQLVDAAFAAAAAAAAAAALLLLLLFLEQH
jgi:hypothetical protein